jgi:membrane fusion protein (multidrug efflux system)
MANSFSQTTRSLAQEQSCFDLVVWLLALLLLTAWLLWFLFAPVTVFEVSHSARVEVERAAHPIAAQVDGKILFNAVQLEKEIKAGDILVEMDAHSERLALEEEQARLKALPPQLQALQRQIDDEDIAIVRLDSYASNSISQARSRYQEALAAAQFAKDQAQRLEQLQATGRIADIDAVRARSEVEKTRAAADALAFEMERLTAEISTKRHEKQAWIESLHREVALLQGQVEISTATVARLQQAIDKHLIRAPIAGKIGEAAALEPGAYIKSGTVVGRIVPPGELKVIADFNPAHALGRVLPNQTAHMRLDGFPWAQYGSIQVRVQRVASEVREGYVRVELIPESGTDSAQLMQHGLPGSVEIEIEKAAPVVLALRAAGQMLSRPVQQATSPLAFENMRAER